jgi:hypothetical protein
MALVVQCCRLAEPTDLAWAVKAASRDLASPSEALQAAARRVGANFHLCWERLCLGLSPTAKLHESSDVIALLPRREENAMTGSIWKRYGYGWVTLGFFLLTLSGHWLFGWFAFVNEQAQHNAPVELSSYTVEMMRDMFENWQSEFLQLIWQVGGLALLLHVGSPQSKEGDDRMEAKIDAILAAVDPKSADRIIDEIDREYAGRHTDPRWKKLAKADAGRG